MATTQQEKARAAAARAAANLEREELRSALTAEKAGYEHRGLQNRAAQVQAQLDAIPASDGEDDDEDDEEPVTPKTRRRGPARAAVAEPAEPEAVAESTNAEE